MREEFYNASGSYCVFTDDGILCKSSSKNRFYPYGSIDKIGFSLGSLDIQGKLNGTNKAFIYVADGNDQKERIKTLIDFAMDKKKSSLKYDIIEIDLQKTVNESEKEVEEYLRAKCASNNQVVLDKNSSKKTVGIIVAIVLALLIVLPVSGIIVNELQRNSIYKNIESGNYVDAYRICTMMVKTQEIQDIMTELEPRVLAEAEELYLSGDVKGADLLLQQCLIDYPGYHYVLNQQYKFATLSGLTHIVIPNDVTYIPRKAFEGCTLLESVVIPNSITKIGECAFEGCTSLKSVVIPDSVTKIERYAFWRCESLTDVEIPDSVISIGKWAFLACSSLKSVTIPDSVTKIEEGTFFGCESLINVEIPNSVTQIGEEAFRSCDSLTNIVIPNSVTIIGSFAFQSCDSLKSIVIPKSVKSIREETFYNCKSLISVTIPSNVEAIDEKAFFGCSSLKQLVLEEGVERIWDYAFYGCESLTKVVIPNSVTNIGNFAFDDCDSLTIYCKCKETRKWGIRWNGDSSVVWEYKEK